MRILNVIVSGPDPKIRGAFIKTLTQAFFRSPEQMAAGKSGDTYQVDFGRLTIDDQSFLYLAGVPSDEQFSFIWEGLAEGLLGFVVVVDAKDARAADHTAELISRLKKLVDIPVVVAFNGLGDAKDADAVALKETLGVAREDQVVCCDVTDKESAKKVLNRLFRQGAKLARKLSA